MALAFEIASRGTSGTETTLANAQAPILADADDLHVLFNPTDNGRKIGGIKITNNSGDEVWVHIDGVHPKQIQGGTRGADPEATSAWAAVTTTLQHVELNLWEWELIANGESKEFVNQKNGIPGIGKVYAQAVAATADGITWSATLT